MFLYIYIQIKWSAFWWQKCHQAALKNKSFCHHFGPFGHFQFFKSEEIYATLQTIIIAGPWNGKINIAVETPTSYPAPHQDIYWSLLYAFFLIRMWIFGILIVSLYCCDALHDMYVCRLQMAYLYNQKCWWIITIVTIYNSIEWSKSHEHNNLSGFIKHFLNNKITLYKWYADITHIYTCIYLIILLII